MDAERWRQVKDILDQVTEHPPARRRRWVERLCRDDETLRREVLDFLELDERADAFIDAPLWRVLPSSAGDHDDDATRRIGPYRLERLIGKGGMGEVHLAVREDDYEQKVALKRSLGPVRGDELLTRFVTERQILARLQHPGIARLLDGGTDDDGFPYLVMEYVDGEPIDRYCDRHEIDLRQRLRLMSRVCRIVHDAHKNLIVHRDLKPSNILVTADGRPRLLDFGIAKLLDPTFDVAATARGKAVMTPACASPEQIMGETVTTACDVYALGVLLYRLLTGRQPYKLSGLSFPAIRRVVCLRKLERPSDAIEAAEADPDGDADLDASTGVGPPAAPSRRIRGDLDAIVLKAMRKEPEHRYGSAAEMADDIDRYLDGLPVLARKGNWYYHAGKHLRRNKPIVALMLLIVALGVTSSILGWQAEQARRSEVAARESAESLKNVLVGILQAPAPDQAKGRDLTVREVLENARPKIESDLAGRPELQAEMLRILGTVFSQLGYADKALDLYQDALARHRELDPSASTELASAVANVGAAYYALRQYPAAVRAYRAALTMREAIGDDPLEVARTLVNLTNARNAAGQRQGLEDDYRRILELRRAHGAPPEDIAWSLYSLGAWMLSSGDTGTAIESLEEALSLQRRLTPSPHTRNTKIAKSLARAYHAAGRLTDARALYEEAIDERGVLFGEGHHEVESLRPHLIRVLLDLDALAEACAMAREIAARAEAELPPEDPDAILARSVLGACLLRSGDGDRGAAEAMVTDGIRWLETRRGPDAFTTVWTRRQLDPRPPR